MVGEKILLKETLPQYSLNASRRLGCQKSQRNIIPLYYNSMMRNELVRIKISEPKLFVLNFVTVLHLCYCYLELETYITPDLFAHCVQANT